MRNTFKLLIMLLCATFGLFSAAQSAQTGGSGMRIQIGNNNDARVDSGTISDDAEISGITIINDRLWINGREVARGTTRYTAHQTGKRYRIQWGKNGNIAVTEE